MAAKTEKVAFLSRFPIYYFLAGASRRTQSSPRLACERVLDEPHDLSRKTRGRHGECTAVPRYDSCSLRSPEPQVTLCGQAAEGGGPRRTSKVGAATPFTHGHREHSLAGRHCHLHAGGTHWHRVVVPAQWTLPSHLSGCLHGQQAPVNTRRPPPKRTRYSDHGGDRAMAGRLGALARVHAAVRG